jgi:hypothetical protein
MGTLERAVQEAGLTLDVESHQEEASDLCFESCAQTCICCLLGGDGDE